MKQKRTCIKRASTAKWWKAASHMPRLTFDRAVEYLMSRPEIALMVFDKVKDSGAIRYNHAMQVWEGVSREEDKL